MADFKFGQEPTKDVLDYFRSKGWKPGFSYKDVWGAEHASAFTVAKATEMDVLRTIRQSLDEALEQGIPFSQFKRDLTPRLQKLGWWGKKTALDPLTGEIVVAQLGSPRRLKTIYRSNIRTAHAVGVYQRSQRTKKALPYFLYQLGPSEVHREEHVNWNGMIAPVDDPIWDSLFPPNGWGCKCRLRQISKREATKRDYSKDKIPELEMTTWRNDRTGEVLDVPVGVDPAWDGNPGRVRAAILNKKLKTSKSAAKAVLKEPLPSPKVSGIPDAFSTAKKVSARSFSDVLNQIPDAQEQVLKLARFTEKHKIKSLFIKQTEMNSRGKASWLIKDQVLNYLGEKAQRYGASNYTIRKASRVNGFTGQGIDHVVVKVKAGTNPGKINPADLAKTVDIALTNNIAGDPSWSLSDVMRKLTDSGDHGGALVTWLHEIGHQVQFKSKLGRKPAKTGHLTVYSATNDYEYHAEHFAAWVLNRKALVKFDPEAATYFDDLIESAIND